MLKWCTLTHWLHAVATARSARATMNRIAEIRRRVLGDSLSPLSGRVMYSTSGQAAESASRRSRLRPVSGAERRAGGSVNLRLIRYEQRHAQAPLEQDANAGIEGDTAGQDNLRLNADAAAASAPGRK